MSLEVVLYGRPGCCLCDDAREILERVRAERPFELAEVDIETDDRLLSAYLERIPVVTVNGAEAFELFVDEIELRRLVASAAVPAVPAVPQGPTRVDGR